MPLNQTVLVGTVAGWDAVAWHIAWWYRSNPSAVHMRRAFCLLVRFKWNESTFDLMINHFEWYKIVPCFICFPWLLFSLPVCFHLHGLSSTNECWFLAAPWLRIIPGMVSNIKRQILHIQRHSFFCDFLQSFPLQLLWLQHHPQSESFLWNLGTLLDSRTRNVDLSKRTLGWNYFPILCSVGLPLLDQVLMIVWSNGHHLFRILKLVQVYRLFFPFVYSSLQRFGGVGLFSKYPVISWEV